MDIELEFPSSKSAKRSKHPKLILKKTHLRSSNQDLFGLLFFVNYYIQMI